MSPEDHTSVLQSISSSLLPFLQPDGKPSLPPFAWFATFSGTLFAHKVFGGRGVDLTDAQKNPLLLDILGEHGEQHLDLSVDGDHGPFDTTPHAMLVQVVHKYLEDLATDHSATVPSSTLTGTGKP